MSDELIEVLELLDPVSYAYSHGSKIRVGIQGGPVGMGPSTEQVVKLTDILGIHGELRATQDHYIEIEYDTENLRTAVSEAHHARLYAQAEEKYDSAEEAWEEIKKTREDVDWNPENMPEVAELLDDE